MGNASDVYSALREELKGTGAEVLTPDSEGYAESIRRWSEHCEKKAVRTRRPSPNMLPPSIP